MVLTVAAGVLLAVIVIRAVVGLIDWLDWRTSRITDEEASRRARLTMEGHWPPSPHRTSHWKPVAVTWVIIGALWSSWMYLRSWR